MEAIENLLALRLRIEQEASIAQLRLQRSGDPGSQYAVAQVLEIAAVMKTCLHRWHKMARRRRRS